ncbi:MAG: STN and carboxypeptidase regulatory-like domain-containing protein [Flavobacteriales bacterium]
MFAAFGLQAQSILHRNVDVHASNVRLADALSLIAQDGNFKLSYNAAVINGDSIVDVNAGDVSVEKALGKLLSNGRSLKESGEHVIILGPRQGKKKFPITGSVVDAANGHAIAHASIYEVRERNAALTDANGAFTLEASGRQERTALRIARVAYQDTVVFVGHDGKLGRVRLRAKDVVPRMQTLRPGVEELDVSRVLVRGKQAELAENFDFGEERKWQLSLVPTIGTNGRASGAMVNKYSLNVIGGYARGMNGFELAGAFNMERRDVKGVQLAGLTNLVGGGTNGVQIAGAVNHTMSSLYGMQIAGFGNVVWDTLSGVQLAGAINVLKGGMLGTQISGLANVTTQGCDGAQFTGGVNVTLKDVHRWQVSGVLNYGRSVSGAQVSGGANVALDSVGGGQVSGLLNYAKDVDGGQVTGLLNVALRSVRGGQVGFVNVSRKCEGGQLGFLNISDTISGASIGFLSFAWHGYHRLDVAYDEVFPITATLRTGTHRFYNSFSYSPEINGRWGFGYGAGTEIGWPGKHVLNIELDAQHVNEDTVWLEAVNILSSLRLTYGFVIANRVVLSAGPSLHVLVSDWRDEETGAYLSQAAPRVQWEEADADTRRQGWIGFRVGLGVRF